MAFTARGRPQPGPRFPSRHTRPRQSLLPRRASGRCRRRRRSRGAQSSQGRACAGSTAAGLCSSPCGTLPWRGCGQLLWALIFPNVLRWRTSGRCRPSNFPRLRGEIAPGARRPSAWAPYVARWRDGPPGPPSRPLPARRVRNTCGAAPFPDLRCRRCGQLLVEDTQGQVGSALERETAA